MSVQTSRKWDGVPQHSSYEVDMRRLRRAGGGTKGTKLSERLVHLVSSRNIEELAGGEEIVSFKVKAECVEYDAGRSCAIMGSLVTECSSKGEEEAGLDGLEGLGEDGLIEEGALGEDGDTNEAVQVRD